MQQYDDILRKVSAKEITMAVILTVILSVLFVLTAVRSYRYYERVKKKHKSTRNAEKQMKVKKQHLAALIALICIAVGFGGFVIADAAVTACNIKKDVKQRSYVTYTGEYRVRKGVSSRHGALYNKWVSVELDNLDAVYIYIDDLPEALGAEYGQFSGTVVYGENSLIVVDIISE